ncbi:MAG: M15 family metallopeptidase [Turicibacter sp.]|nr:M15 family metallopeptidase [Turicibacter sp.]
MEHFFSQSLEERFGPGYAGRVYTDAKVMPHEKLRYLSVVHVGFDGKDHLGELIVHEELALEVLDIFRELYDLRFPIEKIQLVSEYGYSDDLSMADNNSSGFNFRKVAETDQLSEHAFGRAIDINPQINPYILASGEVLPPSSLAYLDRESHAPGKILEGSPILEVFGKRGWFWGGDWTHIKDYHHFEKPAAWD